MPLIWEVIFFTSFINIFKRDTLLFYIFLFIYLVRVKTKYEGVKNTSKNCMHLLLLSNSHTEDQKTKIWSKFDPAGKGTLLYRPDTLQAGWGYIFSFNAANKILDHQLFFSMALSMTVFQIFILFPSRLPVLHSNFILYIGLWK